MKEKELLKFLDEIDSQRFRLDNQGNWLIPLHAFILKFKDEKEESIKRELNRFVKYGILVHIANRLYANPRGRSIPDDPRIEIAKKLRPYDQMYLSLDTRANELGMILQVPNRLTFATDGRSYVYNTSFGIIEFSHQDIGDIEKVEGVEYDRERKIFVANKERVIKDAKRHRRYYLLGLIDEVTRKQ
jgi:hypothetical protein